MVASTDTDITPQRLGAVAERLHKATEPSEPVFLTVGDRLAQSIDVIRSLTQELELLSQSVGGEAVESSIASLRQAAGQVVTLTAGLTDEESAIDRLSAAAAGGGRWIGVLHKTIGEVGIVGTNAKIQAAQLVGAGTDFTVFIDEIGRLAHIANEGLERLGKRHAGLNQLIATALVSQKSFAAAHGSALTDVGGRLAHSLKVLEGHHRRAGQMVADIGRRSEDIGRQIGQAVRSLQINDITRQRIEHVVDALNKGRELIEGRAAWCTGLDEIERRNLAGILCRLQSIQLRKTGQQFDGEVRALLDSLRGLARDAQALCTPSTLPGNSGRADADESPFDQLRRDLDQAKGLLLRFAEAKTSMHDVISRVSDDVREMTLHVEEVRGIESDIRIMGLNATLKCSRLGEKGRALAVIAQELRHCANRTQDQAKAVEDNLQGLIGAAQVLDQGGQDGKDGGMHGTVAAMTQSLSSLEAAEDDVARRMASFYRQGENAQRLLAEASAAISEHHALGEECRALAGELEVMAAAATQGMTDDRQLEEKARTLLSGHYTMAAERDVHDLFFGHDAPPTAEVASTDADLEGVLF